jgi:hypothetical protein
MTANRPAALLFLRSLILAVAWGGAVVSVQAAPVVSNLTAAQRAGTKLVDISYDLAAPGFGSVAVTLEASSDGGATWTVPVASATGAVGGSVTPGTGKAIVWNAGVDWLGNYSTQMRFRVVADGTSVEGNLLNLFTTRVRGNVMVKIRKIKSVTHGPLFSPQPFPNPNNLLEARSQTEPYPISSVRNLFGTTSLIRMM